MQETQTTEERVTAQENSKMKTSEQIASEIVDWAKPLVKAEIDVNDLAWNLMIDAVENNPGDTTLNVEIPSRYTVSDNPIVGSFDYPSEFVADECPRVSAREVRA